MRAGRGLALPGNRWDLLDGLAPQRPPTVTAVVTHFEDQHGLDLVLAGLAQQTHPADRLQVVVADDGSRTPPVVPPGVVLVRQDDRGFRAAAARNLGAAAADGEVLCFLDGDTVPEPSYVERAVRLPALCADVLVVGRRRHADLGALAPQGLAAFFAHPEGVLAEPRWLLEAYQQSRALLDADVRSYRHVISAVLTVARSLFDDVGGFDEDFVGYGGEDWDLAHRLWCAGALFAHEPAAVAWHDGDEWGLRAARDLEGARRQKNAETRALAARVPDPQLRGRGPWAGAAEVVVRYRPSGDDDADLLAVRTMLTSHHDVRVGETTDPWLLARAAVVVDVDGPTAVDVGAVRDLLVGDVGLVLGPGVRAVTTRAAARAARHGLAVEDVFACAEVATVSCAGADLSRELPRR